MQLARDIALIAYRVTEFSFVSKDALPERMSVIVSWESDRMPFFEDELFDLELPKTVRACS